MDSPESRMPILRVQPLMYRAAAQAQHPAAARLVPDADTRKSDPHPLIATIRRRLPQCALLTLSRRATQPVPRWRARHA